MNKRKNKILIFILIVVVIALVSVGVSVWNNYENDEISYQEENTEMNYQEKNEQDNIPTTDKKIKNIILMIGDGMGENHVNAGEIYKGEKLNIQKINNKSYVKTLSIDGITDSAAAATAIATGYKTSNGMLGKDQYGKDVENLTEYAKKQKMKTGIVCTQILNHATPAGFSVHNHYRYNYDEIAISQIKSDIDIMLGGGRTYFSKYETKMIKEDYQWINNLSELEDIDEDSKVIGTFGEDTISKEISRTSLNDMTEAAISRLENEEGFFLMVEGSDIDKYSSYDMDMKQMLKEMIDFDDAVKIAMDYVDNNEDTLLIVTADHETGGLKLDGITSASQLTNSLFTTNEHTSTNVLLYAYGIGEEDLTQYDFIDNTSIYKFIKQGIENNKD